MINRIIDFSANNKLIVFLVVAAAALMGWWSMKNLPLDAIPDLSETQVIIYSRWDRSPDIVEDQVTYPIVSATDEDMIREMSATRTELATRSISIP